MFDPVMYDLDRYLDEEAQRESYSNAVDNIQVDLMKEGCEFYPYTGDRVSEAIGECTQAQLDKLASLVATPAAAFELQDYLSTLVHHYWLAQSESTAIKIMERQIEDWRNNDYED